LEHGNLPDPVAEAIRFVLKEQDKLKERLKNLEDVTGTVSPNDELQEKTLLEAVFSQGGGI
jgi:serine O-acetyltransferase